MARKTPPLCAFIIRFPTSSVKKAVPCKCSSKILLMSLKCSDNLLALSTISRIVWKAFAESRSVGEIKFPAALLTTCKIKFQYCHQNWKILKDLEIAVSVFFYHRRKAKFKFNLVHGHFYRLWVSDIQLRHHLINSKVKAETWTGRTVPPVAAFISEAADSSTGNRLLAIATFISWELGKDGRASAGKVSAIYRTFAMKIGQTLAPKLENFKDMPLPSPVPPPVTNTTCKEFVFFSRREYWRGRTLPAKEPGGSMVSFLMGKCLAWGRGGYFSSSFKATPTEKGLIWFLEHVRVASLRFTLELVSPNRRKFLAKLAMSVILHVSFYFGYHSVHSLAYTEIFSGTK